MKNEFLKPLTMHSGHVLYGSCTRPRLYVAQIYVSVTGVSCNMRLKISTTEPGQVCF